MSINEKGKPWDFEAVLNPHTGEFEMVPYNPDNEPTAPAWARTPVLVPDEPLTIHITPEMQPKPVPAPTLKDAPTVEELAGEAVVFLRDLIICCQFALDQEPGWPTVPDPPYRRPIDRRCAVESLIRRTETILRAALKCKDGAALELLSDPVDEIEREIRDEIPKRGSLPSRNKTFEDSLNEISVCLHNWCKVVNFRARLLLAPEFRLPDDQDFFEKRQIQHWALENGLGKSANNISERLNRNKDFIENDGLSREGLIQFLRDLRDNVRNRAP